MKQTIEARLDAVEAELATVKAQLAAVGSGKVAPPLPDVDISGQYGDPEVRKDPPRWKGQSCVGSRYSECPPEYLDSLAGFLQWKAKKNDEEGKEKYAGYDRLDAARAIAWAERKRAEASRYGTTGAGPVKHMVPPERDLDAELGDDDGSLPF